MLIVSFKVISGKFGGKCMVLSILIQGRVHSLELMANRGGEGALF